jgi:DNA-binding CsgD family transcriptional regulator
MTPDAPARCSTPPPGVPPDRRPLMGRNPEIGRLRALTDPARSAGHVLVVLGDAGAGKTALLADLLRHARPAGFRVLTISGRQPETDLELAGLHQLLRPLAGQMPGLCGQQRTALQRVLGREQEASCPDRLPIAAAALSLVTLASQNRPLLVIADDAHWLDCSSLDVLAFIGHRLQDEQVVLVLSGRGLVPPPALGAGFPELHVGPLSESAAGRLLDSLPDPPAGHLRHRVITQAAGNPLALIELARAVAAEPAARQYPVQLPLPLSDVLTARFADDIARLPASTRSALLIAAADIPAGTSMSLALPGVDAEELAPAERLGLIRVTTSGVRFADPLRRSAIYHGAPFWERAAAHRQLAAGLGHEPDRQAWHVAAATLQPDEAIAARLESTAGLAQQREGAVGAALALERAAELSPDPCARARRLTSAASAAVPTGQARWVHDLAMRALGIAADPELRLAASRAAGWSLAWTDRHADALPILLAVVDDAATCQPAVAWDVLTTAAIVAYLSGTRKDRQLVSQALERLEGDSGPAWSRGAAGSSDTLAACIRASTDPFAGRAVDDLVARLRRTDAAASIDPAVPGVVACLLDEPDLAIRLLTEAVHRLKAVNVRGASGVALSALSRAYADVGQWDESLAAAAGASQMAEAYQLDVVADSAGLTAATVLAMRADAGDARGNLTDVLARVGQSAGSCAGARACHADGLAAFADGSHLAAYTRLRQLFLADGSPLHYHVSYLGIADLAAAAVRADRQEEGIEIVNAAVLRLEGAMSPRLEQLTARALGLLAAPRDGAARFERVLSDPAGARWPFERAQLQLDYGELLRRQRRISDARPYLAAAVETFQGLRARSWARRAEAELRACGIGIADAPTAPEALADLTPQQREIVRLAGSGLTNREIADRLFLSPRTVSSHLYRAYPKMGVAGRHQLRAVAAPAVSLSTSSP